MGDEIRRIQERLARLPVLDTSVIVALMTGQAGAKRCAREGNGLVSARALFRWTTQYLSDSRRYTLQSAERLVYTWS